MKTCLIRGPVQQPQPLPNKQGFKQGFFGQQGAGQQTVTGTCSQMTLGTHRVTV